MPFYNVTHTIFPQKTMFRTSTWKKVVFIEGRKKYSIHNSAGLPVAIGNTRVLCFTAAKVIA